MIDGFDILRAWVVYLAKIEFREDIDPKDLRKTFSCPAEVDFEHPEIGEIRIYGNETFMHYREIPRGFRTNCFNNFSDGFREIPSELIDPYYKAGAEIREKF